jgi:hypothetical protein
MIAEWDTNRAGQPAMMVGMESSKHGEHRWFSFSLRTLLIVMTSLGCVLGWVGWNLKMVRQREATRSWLENQGGLVCEYKSTHPYAVVPQTYRSYDASCEPSWLRKMLGDQTVRVVDLPPALTEAQRKMIEEVFSEAEMRQYDETGWNETIGFWLKFKPSTRRSTVGKAPV